MLTYTYAEGPLDILLDLDTLLDIATTDNDGTEQVTTTAVMRDSFSAANDDVIRVPASNSGAGQTYGPVGTANSLQATQHGGLQTITSVSNGLQDTVTLSPGISIGCATAGNTTDTPRDFSFAVRVGLAYRKIALIITEDIHIQQAEYEGQPFVAATGRFTVVIEATDGTPIFSQVMNFVSEKDEQPDAPNFWLRIGTYYLKFFNRSSVSNDTPPVETGNYQASAIRLRLSE